MPRSRKPTPRQLEVTWDNPEPFTLTIQTTTDGDRVAQEAAQSEADRKMSDLLQEQML